MCLMQSRCKGAQERGRSGNAIAADAPALHTLMPAYMMHESKGFFVDRRASCAGKELYMIPGIDMLNHSTRPEDVNTTLQRRTETVSKHSSSHGDMDFSGFFAIEAGELVTLLSHVLARVQKWGSIPHPTNAQTAMAALELHLTTWDNSDTCCNMLGLSSSAYAEHWPLMCHSGVSLRSGSASASAGGFRRVRCCWHAERPIKAGEEVMISYGDLSDAQLLQTYGFVEEYEDFGNPWNYVAVPSNIIAQVYPCRLSPAVHDGVALDNSLQGGICTRRLQAITRLHRLAGCSNPLCAI